MKFQPKTYLGWDGSEWLRLPFDWESSIDDSKKLLTQVVNDQSYTYLQPTDWIVVRQAETGVAAPTDLTSWRQAIRDCASEKIKAIARCKTKDALKEYTTTDDFLTWPDEPASLGG